MKKSIIILLGILLFTSCEKEQDEIYKHPPIVEILSPIDGSIYFKSNDTLFSDTYYEIDQIEFKVMVKDIDGYVKRADFKLTNIETKEVKKWWQEQRDNNNNFSSALTASQITTGEYLFEISVLDNHNLSGTDKSKFSILEKPSF